MSNCPARHQWEHFLDDRLPAEEQQELEGHAQGCDSCQQLLEELTQPAANATASFHASPHGTALSRDASSLDEGYCRHLAQLLQGRPAADVVQDEPKRESAPLPQVPGYELLEELGRGGMGVVFKARQTGLNRLVALKMVLGGYHSDPEHLIRFRREAEAVAQLQHPHIVQIHEIGTLEGQPYFAMEYVSGGSLDRTLRGQPQPPRDAAVLVRTLAVAMHTAHERGIIHRDLKPANVLLSLSRAPQARVSSMEETRACGAWLNDSVPKITDFGLAKRLEDESGQTRTGDVVGTPSYMAPEQAAGKTKQIGPAADIYALGAILYEMLTGRPPFKGITPMETVLEVLANEPLPPRRLMPKLPRDLDTICLKCLQKEPSRRYLTATALAEDLQRFVDGRSILARPAGRLETTWRWCRRNPALASLAGLLGLAVLGLAVGFALLWRSYDQLAQAQQETQTALSAETKRRKQARDALDAMTGKVMDDLLAGQQQLKEADRVFLREALARYREFARDTGDDPASRADVAHAFGRVGDILGRLGDDTEAEKSYLQAIQQYQQVLREMPHVIEYRQQLARTYFNLSVLLSRQNSLPAARVAAEQSYTLRRQLVADYPDRLEFAIDEANCHNALGVLMTRLNLWPSAREHHQEALRLFRAACRAQPANAEWQDRCSLSLRDAAAMHIELGELPTALALYAEAERVTARLVDKNPTFRYWQHRLGILTLYATTLTNLGKTQDAQGKLEAANRLAEQLVRDFPAMPELRQEWGHVLLSLGNCRLAQSDLASATAYWRQAHALLARLAEDYPKVLAYRTDLASVVMQQAEAHFQSGRYVAARKDIEESINLFQKLLEENPKDRFFLDNLSSCYSSYGIIFCILKDYSRAKKAFQESERLRLQAMAENPKNLRYVVGLAVLYSNMGTALLEEGNPAAAAEWYGKSITHLKEVLRKEPRLAEARGSLYNAYQGRVIVHSRLRRYADTLADVAHMRQLDSSQLSPLLRLPRALALIHTDDVNQAVAEAGQLTQQKTLTGDQHFDLARIWAVAAHRVGNDPAKQEKYAATAVQQLRQAQAKGFFQGEKTRQQLHSEVDFSTLRQRPDFRKLLEELPLSSPGQKPHSDSASFAM